jgi:CRISPR-associated protein Cmr1
MSKEQERRALTPVVDRTALAKMAADAKNAYAALRPGGKPPRRRTTTGKEACEISVRLQVVTPILGGGPRLRDVDYVDVIRVPTVRGHLRFWWRALYGHLYENAADLHKDESALWGRPADEKEKGGRSEVEIRVDIASKVPPRDRSRVSIGSIDGYALWPAREPHADRRPPGTEFTLTIIGPLQHKAVLQNSLRAWILFGGYGSRTRRGLGSLTVTASNQIEESEQCKKWLPTIEVGDDPKDVRKMISACFGSDIFLPSEEATQMPNSLPRLAGAALLVHLPGPKDPNNRHKQIGFPAMKAWTESLGWLRSFRQGTAGDGARERTASNPGLSNWPEADKIRHLTNKKGHKPRHNDKPAFPRAGFGLPIVMKFKPGAGDPDKQYDILWKSPQGRHERLASPLILKALPLANGRFLPMALWLDRNDPPGSKVYVKGHEHATADFDVLVAAGDTARYSGELAKALRPRPALPAKSSLRGFFLAYLEGKGVRRIAI